MIWYELKIPRNIENPCMQMEQVWNVLQEARVSGVLRISIKNDKIKFLFDEKIFTVLKTALYSHLHGVEIEKVEVLEDRSNYVYVGQSGLPFYPVKRYSQLEDRINRTMIDPAMTFYESLQEGDLVEFEIFPVSNRLRRFYSRVVKMVHDGFLSQSESLQKIFIGLLVSRSNFVRLVFFPVWIFLYVKTLYMGSAQDTPKYDLLREEVTQQHYRETAIEAAMDKINKPMIGCEMRLFVKDPKFVSNALGGVKLPNSNGFELRKRRCNMILNTEEFATLVHLPFIEKDHPKFNVVHAKKLAYRGPRSGPGYSLGMNEFMGERRGIGLDEEARRRHLYVVGKTGAGKTSLLKSLIVQDLGGASGICLFDPHGDLVTELLDLVPKNRLNEVLYLDFTDKKFCYPINLFAVKSKNDSDRVVAGVISVFKNIFKDSWGPRLEFILRNALLLLVAKGGSNLSDLHNFFIDEDFLKEVVCKSKASPPKHFFENTYLKWQPKFRQEAIAPIVNKVGQFWGVKVVRDTFGGSDSVIDFDFMMNNKRIILINLSKGMLGEDVSKFMGSMIFTQLYNVALNRAKLNHDFRQDFYVYLDEFQNFATDVFGSVLSEARKYRFNLILAHQFVSQLDDTVRDAIFGNVGNLLSFQVGADDAEILSQQFEEFVEPADLLGLELGQAYMKNFSPKYIPPFSLQTNKHLELSGLGQCQKIKKLSRERFGRRCYS